MNDQLPSDRQGSRNFRDKSGRLALATRSTPVALELGCGLIREYPDAIGVDLLDVPGVDVVGDVYDVLAALPDGSVSAVYSSHFLEHVRDPIELIEALARVVRPGGTVETTVPHFSNPYFASDPTHKAAFGLYSFSYLTRDDLFRREVPNYFGTPAFALTDVHMAFPPRRPFYVRSAVSRVVQKVVNRRPWSAEKYERWWCYVWPCYEMTFTIRRLDA